MPGLTVSLSAAKGRKDIAEPLVHNPCQGPTVCQGTECGLGDTGWKDGGRDDCSLVPMLEEQTAADQSQARGGADCAHCRQEGLAGNGVGEVDVCPEPRKLGCWGKRARHVVTVHTHTWTFQGTGRKVFHLPEPQSSQPYKRHA